MEGNTVQRDWLEEYPPTCKAMKQPIHVIDKAMSACTWQQHHHLLVHCRYLFPDRAFLHCCNVLQGLEKIIGVFAVAQMCSKVSKLLSKHNQDLILVINTLCSQMTVSNLASIQPSWCGNQTLEEGQ